MIERLLLPEEVGRRAARAADFQRVVGFIAILSLGFFPPSLILAGVPTVLWPLYSAAATVMALLIVGSFVLAPSRSAVAICWAVVNAIAVVAFGWATREHYPQTALLFMLLVAAHATVHGLRAGLAAAVVGVIGMPVLVGVGTQLHAAALVYAGLFLAGSALIPWTAAHIAHRRAIAERTELEQQLRHKALHDPLTGLPNRALIGDRLQHALERTEPPDVRVAVLFIDLDTFKQVNDLLGHRAGDRVLSAVAERFRGCVRSTDTLGRLGGDEFVVLLEDVTDVSLATEIADRILDVLRPPFSVRNGEMEIGASIGIALSEPGQSPAELLNAADLAMYAAKNGTEGYVIAAGTVEELSGPRAVPPAQVA
ncbi:MAG: GGDEF domain-containing protein [Chloroflexi bacterium]|nr:GGDEF domain-containing protein [Chloroflexota bacterium]